MKEETKALLSMIALIMYGVGIVLFFVGLFDSSYDDASAMRTKIFCGMMVGATIIGGIAKMSSGNDEDNS